MPAGTRLDVRKTSLRCHVPVGMTKKIGSVVNEHLNVTTLNCQAQTILQHITSQIIFTILDVGSCCLQDLFDDHPIVRPRQCRANISRLHIVPMVLPVGVGREEGGTLNFSCFLAT